MVQTLFMSCAFLRQTMIVRIECAFFFRFHYRLRPAIIVVIATRKRTRQRLTQLTHSDDCKLTVFSQQTPETCFLILEQNQIKFVLDLTCVELTFVHVTSDY